MIFIDIADVEPRGTIFHIHGGGFALGSAKGSVGLASDLARKTGMRAVSVDYRLAPEHHTQPRSRTSQPPTAPWPGRVATHGDIVVAGESVEAGTSPSSSSSPARRKA